MEVRAYKSGDETAILELDRRLEIHPWNRRNLRNWYWKYTDKNPSGKSFIWLMTEGKNIIAHFAAVPYRLKVFDREIIASHSIGALVEEEYQNKGLLKFVGDRLFEELLQNDISFTYGFPNQRAYRLHRAFMGYLDFIFFDTWKLKKPFSSTASAPLSFQKITEFGNDLDSFWRSCCNGYKIAVVRDKRYLNWRYLQRPDLKYYPFGLYKNNELQGYTVLKLYKDDRVMRGHFLDIFARYDDKDAFKGLIEGGLNFFAQNNVDEVTCWIWGNPLIEKLLTEYGFFQEKTRIPLVIRINKEFQFSNEVKENKNWYFTMGDSTEIF